MADNVIICNHSELDIATLRESFMRELLKLEESIEKQNKPVIYCC